jgi:ATP:corrinoid adenosyltransferase
MNKYNNAKIYKITSNHTPNVFMGSTIRTLKDVLEEHESNYNRYLKDNNNNYCSSFELIKQPTYDIVLIEEVNVETEAELSKIKGEYIKNTDNCINKCVAGRTQKEWIDDNAEHISEIGKEYYKKNKDTKKLKTKEYYEKNKEALSLKKKEKIVCECSSNYTHGGKAKHLKTTKHQDYINNKMCEKIET